MEPSFRFLGSVVESPSGVILDLDDKNARASRTLGLLKSLFLGQLLIMIKKEGCLPGSCIGCFAVCS